jgi:prefoldin subunit 5
MNIIKWLFSNLQLVLVLALLVTIRAGYEVLKERTKALADADSTISTLQLANQLMAEDLETLSQKESGLRVLLKHQNAALAELDNQNRKTADELQQALATPPAGRPDCAREPLPGGALRLLQPAQNHGANPGGETPTTPRAGAPLPGA